MKQQKRPFTVTVKRKKRTPASGSLLADALANEQNAVKADCGSTPDRRRWSEPPELAAIGRAPRAKPVEPNDAAKPASRREPRILDAPTPPRVIEPIEKPRRGPGRPRKHPRLNETLPDKLTQRAGVEATSGHTETIRHAEAGLWPIGKAALTREPQSEVERTKAVAAPPEAKDRAIHERRLPGADRRRERRAAADASLKRGDRWKRHLPRWSR